MSFAAFAQGRPDPAATIAAQRDAMKSFAAMDGVWRGPAWTILPSVKNTTITQTERIGPFLDGSIKVIEAAVTTRTAVLASTPLASFPTIRQTHVYNLHSHAIGLVGDFRY